MSSDKSPIQEAASRYNTDTPLNHMAVIMMEIWGKVDPQSNVAQHPASYISNFADMAQALIDAGYTIERTDNQEGLSHVA